jgi:hypothetical protein
MILLILIFTIKSLWLNYFYSTSLCHLFQIETLGLLVINQNYQFIDKSILELLLLGFIGLPSEIEYVNNNMFSHMFSPSKNPSSFYINILLLLLSWILSLLIVFIFKIINYYIRFKKIEKEMIFKIIIKFFITNYLPLLLLNFLYLYHQTINNKYIYTLNIYLIVLLIFVLPSLYLKILYGNRRYVDKKKYISLFIRFKPSHKLWFLFLLLMKNLYFISFILKVLLFDKNYNYLYNYLIYLINFTKIYLEYKYQPYTITDRKDNKFNGIFNIITIIFIIFNEINYWININIIEYIKLLILLKILLMIIYLSIRNFKLNNVINNNIQSLNLINLVNYNDLDI